MNVCRYCITSEENLKDPQTGSKSIEPENDGSWNNTTQLLLLFTFYKYWKKGSM